MVSDHCSLFGKCITFFGWGEGIHHFYGNVITLDCLVVKRTTKSLCDDLSNHISVLHKLALFIIALLHQLLVFNTYC